MILQDDYYTRCTLFESQGSVFVDLVKLQKKKNDAPCKINVLQNTVILYFVSHVLYVKNYNELIDSCMIDTL